MPKLKFIKKAYHRNGIAGNGFHTVLFKHGKDKMIGIVFDEPNCVAVFNKELLNQDIIEFGENSWSGDVYEKQLREWTKEEHE